jgi:hypothetical protein
MMTYRELADLAERLQEQSVLSVYINGAEPDPARRRRWRIDLRHAFDDIERWLEGATHAEREAFATCRAAALERLDGFRGTVQSPGWAGFFTIDREQRTDSLPVEMPTMAIWSTGPCLTPYLRALKEARAVIVAIVDRRKARLFSYALGKADFVTTIRAQARVEPPSHMGQPERAGFHHGTRGPTGTDEAQRELRKGTADMLAELTGRIVDLATGEAWILFGGIPSVVAAAMEEVPEEMRGRAMVADSLEVHATTAQVAASAREGASALRDAQDLLRVNASLTGADSGGRGTRGPVDTARALEEGRVRELFFTRRYLDAHAADLEAMVRRAVRTRAVVEQVSGKAAERLDAAGGLSATLRYAAVPLLETADALT